MTSSEIPAGRAAERTGAGKKRQRVAAFDVVGDIAIISLADHQRETAAELGRSIMASNNRIRVVAARTGRYGGDFRTVPLTILAGEDRLETEVREFGVRLRLNVAEVYYSVRSGRERQRVAAMVQPDERVLVLFSGIAPYPLQIARIARPRLVVGVEKNPVAHDYAMINCRLNDCLERIELRCGDVATIVPRLAGLFDRVIMPLPTQGGLYLDTAITALRPGGWLHYYDMQEKSDFPLAIAKVAKACDSSGRRLAVVETFACGHCSPKRYRVCVDGRIDSGSGM